MTTTSHTRDAEVAADDRGQAASIYDLWREQAPRAPGPGVPPYLTIAPDPAGAHLLVLLKPIYNDADFLASRYPAAWAGDTADAVGRATVGWHVYVNGRYYAKLRIEGLPHALEFVTERLRPWVATLGAGAPVPLGVQHQEVW